MGRPDYIFGQFRENTQCATRGWGLLCFRTTACYLISVTQCALTVVLIHSFGVTPWQTGSLTDLHWIPQWSSLDHSVVFKERTF